MAPIALCKVTLTMCSAAPSSVHLIVLCFCTSLCNFACTYGLSHMIGAAAMEVERLITLKQARKQITALHGYAGAAD